MKIRFIAVALLVLWGFLPLARAQDSPPKDLTELSLEQLMEIPIYGGSRYEQTEKNVPASVTVVTRGEIQKFGYRTLAEILQSVPGFYLTFDRNYYNLGGRGYCVPGDFGSRYLVLVDGHRLNDPVYNQGPIGTDFPVDVDLIERVEVVKGPGSVMYGANAFFAVIHVITRRGRDVKGLEVSPEVGLYTYKGRATYGNLWKNGLEVLQSGSIYDSQGMRRYPAGGLGVAFDCDYDRYLSSFTKMTYQDFTFTGFFQSRTKGLPTGAWGTLFNDKRNQTIDTRAMADLKYEHAFPRDWGLLGRIYFDYYDYRGTYIYGNAGNPFFPLKNKDIGAGMRCGGEVQLTKKLFDRHHLVFGGEFYQDFGILQRNYDDSPYHLSLNDSRQYPTFAFYGQGQFMLRHDLIFYAGLRYDYYGNVAGALSPRLALIYQPFTSTNLKLVCGQAFRPPNAYELFFDDGSTQKSNPQLKAEKVQTLEAIWEQQLSRNWRLKTSGFVYRISDPIISRRDVSSLIVYVNGGAINARGLEVELAGKWLKYLEGRLSYTLQDARDSQTGLLLPNLPKHLVKANLIFPLFKDKVFIGVENLYSSNRIALTGRKVFGYPIANLTLFTKNIVPKLQVSASVYNLFNQKYCFPGGEEHLTAGIDRLRQDGINFRVKLQYTF
jgi:outer membrane receptor for ferrienterochelin and colicins